MNFLSNFFRTKLTHQEPSQTPPAQDKAIAFVDFEYWFYSYRDLLHISPNVSKWAAEITGQYHVSDIMVFADLSYPRIQQEAQQLRAVTNTIIDTSNLTPEHKKNMTDFIMLDYIYQTAIERPEITTYILFTGDGHFQSAARFLSLKRKKTIILYGVRGQTTCLSLQTARRGMNVSDGRPIPRCLPRRVRSSHRHGGSSINGCVICATPRAL